MLRLAQGLLFPIHTTVSISFRPLRYHQLRYRQGLKVFEIDLRLATARIDYSEL